MNNYFEPSRRSKALWASPWSATEWKEFWGAVDGVLNESDLSYEQEFEDGMKRRSVSRLVGRLPERLAEVIRLRFWENESLDEVANRFGVSRLRIRQLEQQALRFMRHPCRCGKLGEDFLGLGS